MNTIAQIFPRTGRISGPEVADGAKPDVPTTDVENEKKKKKHRVFYEAVDAHARRRLIIGNLRSTTKETTTTSIDRARTGTRTSFSVGEMKVKKGSACTTTTT